MSHEFFLLMLLLHASLCLSVTCNSRKGEISDETVLGKRRAWWVVFFLKEGIYHLKVQRYQ